MTENLPEIKPKNSSISLSRFFFIDASGQLSTLSSLKRMGSKRSYRGVIYGWIIVILILRLCNHSSLS